ncbi:uncharacterized protein LOC105170588 [Sesamum indicum]|uniref:Uncharacterized protein LOC105170588 n=1 Tax=Sesamum indicum TaxID=4182 RepID=A0A6I9U024_SESIN|nr:uncharacterized protein LOC105170588 [Sesamum indicum]
MPFNGVLVASTANASAELWQRLACLSERISSDRMLDLVLCFPLQQLGRWALYVWTYLCVSPYPHRRHYATSYYSDDSFDEDSDDDSALSSANPQYVYRSCSSETGGHYEYSSQSD